MIYLKMPDGREYEVTDPPIGKLVAKPTSGGWDALLEDIIDCAIPSYQDRPMYLNYPYECKINKSEWWG